MGKFIPRFAALIALSSSSCLAAVTEARVVVVNGSVSCKPALNAEAAPVTKGDTVTVGSTIQTEMKSDLLISPLPGAAVRVLENNSVVLTESDLQKKGETVLGRKAKLQLNRGTVQVGLEKIGATTDFKITTPQCVAAARGTVFSTTVVNGATTVVVFQGIVDIPWKDGKGKAHTVDVKAKMRVRIKEGSSGLEQEGPVRATKDEVSALENFIKLAASFGLLHSNSLGQTAIPIAPGVPLVSP
jgi:hypothetical protein